MRDCGSCAMCCKVMPIDQPDISKPGNEWCKHWSKKTKCSIYSTRPKVCAGFYCAWITEKVLPDELRPDKCGAILKYNENGKLIVVVSDRNVNAWREGILGAVLEEYEEGYSVYSGGIKLAEVYEKS